LLLLSSYHLLSRLSKACRRRLSPLLLLLLHFCRRRRRHGQCGGSRCVTPSRTRRRAFVSYERNQWSRCYV